MRYPTPYLSPCPSRYPGRFSASSHAETCRGRCRVSPSESPSLFAAIRVTVPLRPHPSHRPSPPPSESPSLSAPIRVTVPLRRHPSRRPSPPPSESSPARRQAPLASSNIPNSRVLRPLGDDGHASSRLLLACRWSRRGHRRFHRAHASWSGSIPSHDCARVVTVPES